MRDWLKRFFGSDDEDQSGLSVYEQAMLMAEDEEEPTREKQLKILESIDDRLQESNRRAMIGGVLIGTTITAASTVTIVLFQVEFEHAVEVGVAFIVFWAIGILYAVIKLFFSGA